MSDIILIAISLSIDALGVGFVYGIRRIFLPCTPKIIISSISALITLFALMIGSQLSRILPTSIAKIIGVIILLAMGVYLIAQSRKKNIKPDKIIKPKKTLPYKIIIRFLRLTIIYEPQSADINNSKKIEFTEAICIGITLSLDSLINGIGFSILGFNNLFLPLITAFCQYLFLTIGSFCGKKIVIKKPDTSKFITVSGIILVFIALTRLLNFK